MSSVSHEQVETILSNIKDPNIDQDLISEKVIKDINIDGEAVTINLEFAYPIEGSKTELNELIKSSLNEQGISDCTVEITSKIVSHSVQKGVALLKM